MKRSPTALVLTSALLAAGGTLAAPAGASAAPTATSQSPAATSSTIAGWTSHLVGGGSVRRFVVPTLDCRNAQRQAIGVGVGQQTDVIQPDIIAEVVMFCADRTPQYLMEVFVDGAGSASVVSAGDVLRFEISYAAGTGTGTATATDLSNPGENLTMTGDSEPVALHFGAFPYAVDGVKQDVPDFGAVRLVKPRSAGVPLAEATATRVRRVEQGEVKISPSRISDRPASPGTFGLRFESH